jgi:peptidoglycan/xylan/chitin deacetylase (PgdA/CDA1 family)
MVSTFTAQRVSVRRHGIGQSLCLTFDDGPHPEYTPALLDVLAQHQIKATFFLLGNNVVAHPELVERLVREGHVIGNHSMTHLNPRQIGWRAQLTEVDQADEVLARFDQRRRHLYRPPRGCATVTLILNAVLRSPMVLWTFDSLDGKLSEADLVQRLKSYDAQGGDILLFHDDTKVTIEALRQAIPHWLAKGFAFKTVTAP